MGPNKVLIGLLVLLVAGFGLERAGVFSDLGDSFGSDDDETTVVTGSIEFDEPTTSTPTPEPAAATKGPYEPGGLPAITAQLVEELGYTPRMYSILVSDDSVMFRVIDRAKPQNVDTYTWRDGEFADPEPEQVNPSRPVGEAAFALRDVNLAALATLVRRAGALDIEDPEVSTTIIERAIPFAPGVRFLVNVSGSRESRQLRADARGRVTEVI
jgi:hypothetical protein